MSDTTSPTLESYRATMIPVFGVPALTVVRGEGSYVWDEDGNRYLDLLGGIAVNVLGHAHPAVAAAVSAQVKELIHVSNFFATTPAVQLAAELTEIVAGPGSDPTQVRVFLANSGTEANEAALKIVKAWGKSHGKKRVLALKQGFHGRSLGALSVTSKAAYRDPFAPLLPDVEWIDPHQPGVLDTIDENVAGLIVEPIQGEAGVRELPGDFLQAARTKTAAVGALLVVDEVQTGMGRTGKWMGHHHAEITPDVVTLAKGLGGGMPIGATLTLTEAAGSVLTAGMHGSTFGANPVCAAAARAVIATLEEEQLLAHAQQLGDSWRKELREVDPGAVVEVRGRGLLIGIDLAHPVVTQAVQVARQMGFIINATGPQTLRLAPALNISREQARSFTQALPQILAQAKGMA
ncbi:MAG: acetylornithine transaminase [Actinomycetaceae bacterium]|nr:acetylornithine transaminase [Actinomycetaceae bacterium]